MEFRILGPLEVTSGGTVLELGGAKQRALLAVLLLRANEVVPTDRLIDALWEENPPEAAQKSLHVQVSNLRKAIGRERVETKPAGYVLRVREDELDVGRFQRLREQGMPADALALWRGPPLADFAYQRFAQTEIARLEEQRLACLEDRIQQDLAARRHADLTGELEALVAENPLRERLRGQLMLALYRSGRQAEALAAYQDARRVLVDDLGIEPGRELRDLHQQILNQDPLLELPDWVADAPEPAAVEPAAGAPPTGAAGDRESRKTVTVLCAGLITTTIEGDQLDPEALRGVVTRGFAELETAVKRHGGSMEAVSGGAVTVVFGIPAVHEDDALRAVRAAVEASAALGELGEALRAEGVALELRVGISTGEVVAGGPLQPTGTPMTAASGLAQVVAAGQILLDAATVRVVRHAVAVERGDEGFKLLDVFPASAVTTPRSPMVGRARERGRLRQAFEQAIGDRSCQLFTVLGPAGVGKSRLVQEFLGELASEALVARGQCLPYGEGITYWPVLEAVKEAVGLEDDASPADAKDQLLAALADEQDAEALAERVAATIGLAEARPGVEEGLTAIRTLFEALARTRPLVLVFDDIHWGEPTFLDLVENLAEWTRDVPILLLCLARPELLDVRPGWAGGKLNATSILLEPLSEAESAELIENLAEGELDDATERRIVEAAEGNPLFVEEMLALALEEGLPTGEIHVPPTIQGLLTARLDRLDPTERAVIDRASVQGKVFYEEAVATLSPPELSPAVSDSLGSLLRKELIRPERTSFGGRTYRFRHILIRDSAYESVPKEARSEMHEGFAHWLEDAAGERATEYEEIVGYHLEQAYRYRAELGTVDDAGHALARDASERLGAAGRRAFLRSDAPAGVNLISRAVALLPPDDPARVELVPNVRVVQGTGADMSWAERVLTEAIETAASTGDRRLAAHALVQRGFMRLFIDHDVTAEELHGTAERAIAVFEELHDELGLARGWRLKAQAHYLGRSAEMSAEASERALAHARAAGDLFEQREIEEWLVIALLWGPVPATEAVSRCERLLADCAGQPQRESQVLGALALLTTMCGQIDESRDHAAEARRAMGELGEGIWIVSFELAEASLGRGDEAGAEAELRPIYDVLKAIGEKSHFSAIAQLLADAVYRQGRLEEAEQLTFECEAAARSNDVHDQIRWRAVRAKVLASRGEMHAAETLAREAVALASDGDFVVARAGALLDLAEVLGLSDRRDAAEEAAREAIRHYELKGNVLAADRARAWLET